MSCEGIAESTGVRCKVKNRLISGRWCHHHVPEGHWWRNMHNTFEVEMASAIEVERKENSARRRQGLKPKSPSVWELWRPKNEHRFKSAASSSTSSSSSSSSTSSSSSSLSSTGAVATMPPWPSFSSSLSSSSSFSSSSSSSLVSSYSSSIPPSSFLSSSSSPSSSSPIPPPTPSSAEVRAAAAEEKVRILTEQMKEMESRFISLLTPRSGALASPITTPTASITTPTTTSMATSTTTTMTTSTTPLIATPMDTSPIVSSGSDSKEMKRELCATPGCSNQRVDNNTMCKQHKPLFTRSGRSSVAPKRYSSAFPTTR